MLACGIYPQTEAFLSAMAQEADEVLKTYRNCTSIALWSGDNENGQAYGWAGRPYEFESDRISNQVLKEACARLDPRRYYLPTSPASPDRTSGRRTIPPPPTRATCICTSCPVIPA